MNDLARVLFWATWLLFVDLLMLISYTFRRWRLQKSIPIASLATSPQWKGRHLPLSIFFTGTSIATVVFLPAELYASQGPFDQTCPERYLSTECDGATKSWKKFCIWLILPGVLAVVISILLAILARRQVAKRAQANNTSSSQLLYHPGPLLFANAFLVLASLFCTLSGGPVILYNDMDFRTWFRVTEALTVVAIANFIIGSVLTIYGSVMFFTEIRMFRANARPGAQQIRRRNRRSRREWIELV